MSSHGEKHHLIPYSVYVWVWVALLGLTAVTVGAQYTELQHMAIFTAILIATVKGGLVVLYFMHIRYEKPLFGVMILVLFVTYGIYISLTFADYFSR